MNEVELIRHQLALERAHVGAVANACANAMQGDAGAVASGDSLGQFRRACVEYLACALTWFEERDQRLTELVQARFDPSDPARRGLEEVLARRGRSREVLAKLEAASGGTATSGSAGEQQGWREFAEFFNGIWSTRRDALDALLYTNSRATDWRTFGGIDADSIFEERRRYAQVCAQVPPGVVLGAKPE
ncbi:MAG TPA: hypothetical protein VGG67_09640 [Steroidobacteraceae bacterium]|jgi:hypothetical protein